MCWSKWGAGDVGAALDLALDAFIEEVGFHCFAPGSAAGKGEQGCDVARIGGLQGSNVALPGFIRIDQTGAAPGKTRPAKTIS